MRKAIIILAVLFSTVTTMLAQQTKSYVTVFCDMTSSEYYASQPLCYLSGDLPSGMKTKYTYGDVDAPVTDNCYRAKTAIGSVLNLLAAEGYSLEKVTSNEYGSNANSFTLFVMSRNTTTATKIGRLQDGADSECDVREVARYNLQGLPVQESENGIQIIVYSNYTTKTVLVE